MFSILVILKIKWYILFFRRGKDGFLISVCVGSSCHLKGAYEIVEICEELIEKLKQDRIELKR